MKLRYSFHWLWLTFGYHNDLRLDYVPQTNIIYRQRSKAKIPIYIHDIATSLMYDEYMDTKIIIFIWELYFITWCMCVWTLSQSISKVCKGKCKITKWKSIRVLEFDSWHLSCMFMPESFIIFNRFFWINDWLTMYKRVSDSYLFQKVRRKNANACAISWRIRDTKVSRIK